MSLFAKRTAAGGGDAPVRLHLGCGQSPIAGWVNIDVQALPGVDRVLDVRHGLPFENVAAISRTICHIMFSKFEIYIFIFKSIFKPE
jgi:hypothetical protein